MPFSLPFKKTQPDSSHQDGGNVVQIEDPLVNSTLKWKIILFCALLFPILLETLDYTIVATAQTEIASHFNHLDLQSYIGSIYLLTSTVFLPVFASLADVFGRHWALQASLIFFAVGSAISTGAQNMDMMLAGRAIAGVGAAGMMTTVRIIMADSRSLDDNNWQTTLLWVLYAIGFDVGPSVGGALVTVSFCWIFAINLPCAVLLIIISFFLLRGRTQGGNPPKYLRDATEPRKETFLDRLVCIDWVGASMFVSGGILVLLALNWGSSDSWKTARVIVCFIIGGLLFIGSILWQYFLERQQSSPNGAKHRILIVDPLIPVEILRSYDVCATAFASFAGGMLMLVIFYFVAIFMTIVLDLSPSDAGVQLLYFLPGMGGGSILSMTMVRRLRQPRYPIVLSGVVFCVALGLISNAVEHNKQSQINGFMAMAGVAVGLSTSALPIHARFSQPHEKVAAVSALIIFARTFGGTVGLAQCGAVMNSKVTAYIISTAKSGQISLSDAAQLATLSATSVQDVSSFSPQVQTVLREAFRSGTRWCFISLIPWGGVSFIMTLFLKNIEDTNKSPHGEELPMVPLEDKRRASEVELGNARR